MDNKETTAVLPTGDNLSVQGFLDEMYRMLSDDNVASLIMNLDKRPPECEFTVRELLDRNIDNIRTNYFGLMYLCTF